jgi:hypothetical protein
MIIFLILPVQLQINLISISQLVHLTLELFYEHKPKRDQEEMDGGLLSRRRSFGTGIFDFGELCSDRILLSCRAFGSYLLQYLYN